MSDTTPKALSESELEELAAFEPLWELWDVENASDMLNILKQSYCVKFKFMSGGPGYWGDLFIIQGDALSEGPPTELTRDRDGHLELVEYS
jgi:hypothetical protein